MTSRNRLLDKVIKKVSKELSVDPRVVEFVIRQQFRFIAKNVIADPNSSESYRIKYFGVFTPKKTKAKYGVSEL